MGTLGVLLVFLLLLLLTENTASFLLPVIANVLLFLTSIPSTLRLLSDNYYVAIRINIRFVLYDYLLTIWHPLPKPAWLAGPRT